VLVDVVMAKLTAPSPLTNEVTPADAQELFAILTPDAIIEPRAGAFA
jgi:hypothetical protein